MAHWKIFKDCQFLHFPYNFDCSASDNGIVRKTSAPFVVSMRHLMTSFQPCNREKKIDRAL